MTSLANRQQHLGEALARDEGSIAGLAYCRRLSLITDDWVIDLFERALAVHPITDGRIALMAVGGYGRGELAPYSDLDLLIVHDVKPRRVRSVIEPVASALWYPLWDAGVKLGHAVRSVKEQIDIVGEDLDSATALLSGRPLAGDDQLVEEVMAKGRQAWDARRNEHFAALRERVRQRPVQPRPLEFMERRICERRVRQSPGLCRVEAQPGEHVVRDRCPRAGFLMVQTSKNHDPDLLT